MATDGDTVAVEGTAAIVWEYNGSSWQVAAVIDDPTPSGTSPFGEAADVEGDTLAITDNERNGAVVCVYHRDPSRWELAESLSIGGLVTSVTLAGGPLFGMGRVWIAARSGRQWAVPDSRQ